MRSGQLIKYSDLLRVGRSGDRISGRDGIFCGHLDRPWGIPSLLCKGYRVSLSGGEAAGRGAAHPPSFSVEVLNGLETACLLRPAGLVGELPLVGVLPPSPLYACIGMSWGVLYRDWLQATWAVVCSRFLQTLEVRSQTEVCHCR